MTKYEKNVIRPILDIIEKHQDFLCNLENLPQLAKLGFMFEKLWYAGRVAYGYDGLVKKDSSCENNPKYELGDTINYNSEENENLIYDAWGLHVSNDPNQMNFEEFKNLILNGKELSDFEKRLRTPNKTFDEWISLMTDKEYRYSNMFPNKENVANYLLCRYGTGYGYNKNTGMIIKEASGADQDIDLYGEWENAKFIPEIQSVVDNVLGFDMTRIALDAEAEYVNNIIKKQKEKKNKDIVDNYANILPEINKALVKKGRPEININSPEFIEFIEKYLDAKLNEILGDAYGSKNKKGGFEYSSLCSYSIITMLDENTHPSYINAALEICKTIVANPSEIKDGWNDFQIKERDYTINFANEFIKKWGK